MKKILLVFGTRPEAIKMAPLVKSIRQNSQLDAKICVSAQHREMLDQALDVFGLEPDHDLNVMQKNQGLISLTSRILDGVNDILLSEKPDLVLVHGDTTTTCATSLAAFYNQIPVGHVEAGLRTGDLMAPWPEEANRRITSVLTELHFAPTEGARLNLLKENVHPESVFVTGNTVVDALFMIRDQIEADPVKRQKLCLHFPFLDFDKKLILITGHRRESLGAGIKNVCTAIRTIAERFPEVQLVYPVHLNPSVREAVEKTIGGVNNIFLIEPLDYHSFVFLMLECYLVLTDSGGIQEEAPSLGKPVLVTREATERPEALLSNSTRLVGTDQQKIVDCVSELLTDELKYKKMSKSDNPFGDGKSSARITQKIVQYFNAKS